MNEEGLVPLKVQYTDDTKIESVSNKYTSVWNGCAEKNKAKLETHGLGTIIPFLDFFRDRYGRQSDKVVADSGYGNEANYAYMESDGIDAYAKYNMFHAETKRRYANNRFLVQNMYYNAGEDYYVCPMGQFLERCGTYFGSRRHRK